MSGLSGSARGDDDREHEGCAEGAGDDADGKVDVGDEVVTGEVRQHDDDGPDEGRRPQRGTPTAEASRDRPRQEGDERDGTGRARRDGGEGHGDDEPETSPTCGRPEGRRQVVPELGEPHPPRAHREQGARTSTAAESSPMTGHVARARLPVSQTRAACASWIEVRVMTNWMTLDRRAATPMPTSTMRWPASVVPRPTACMSRPTATAPTRAAAGSQRPCASRKVRAMTDAADAPTLMPMMSGLASGLRKVVWNIAPAAPNARPARSPSRARGSLASMTMKEAPGASGSVSPLRMGSRWVSATT